jgi:hypothetical protein
MILLPFIAEVESGNNTLAIGDNGRAVGVYQIHKRYVDDLRGYNYNDRIDATKSAKMVIAYLTRWGKHYEKMTGKPATAKVLARIHNGGPNGWRKDSTVKYWNKIKREMLR